MVAVILFDYISFILGCDLRWVGGVVLLVIGPVALADLSNPGGDALGECGSRARNSREWQAPDSVGGDRVDRSPTPETALVDRLCRDY